VGRNSVVGTMTRYGLDGPGIEFRWGRPCAPKSPMQRIANRSRG